MGIFLYWSILYWSKKHNGDIKQIIWFLSICRCICICLCICICVYIYMHAYIRMCICMYRYIVSFVAMESVPDAHYKRHAYAMPGIA